MATMSDVSIINWNKTEAKPVASGLERTICSQALCGSKTLTVHQRTVLEGRQFDVQAGDDYHLVYVIEAPKGGHHQLQRQVARSRGRCRRASRARRIGAI